jgi:GDP-mannose 6-dehydrogenase
VLGLSFKAGTDDVRESPSVALVEALVGRGYQVRIYDEQVKPERLVGTNKAHLDRGLPHIASLMGASLDEVVATAEVVVIANGTLGFHRVQELLRADHILIDLVGLTAGCSAPRNDPSQNARTAALSERNRIIRSYQEVYQG